MRHWGLQVQAVVATLPIQWDDDTIPAFGTGAPAASSRVELPGVAKGAQEAITPRRTRPMLAHLLDRVRLLTDAAIRSLERHAMRWTRPETSTSLVLGAATDLVRS